MRNNDFSARLSIKKVNSSRSEYIGRPQLEANQTKIEVENLTELSYGVNESVVAEKKPLSEVRKSHFSKSLVRINLFFILNICYLGTVTYLFIRVLWLDTQLRSTLIERQKYLFAITVCILIQSLIYALFFFF